MFGCRFGNRKNPGGCPTKCATLTDHGGLILTSAHAERRLRVYDKKITSNHRPGFDAFCNDRAVSAVVKNVDCIFDVDLLSFLMLMGLAS
jgi:hypothetical protein